MTAVTALFAIIVWDGHVGRGEGALLLVALVAFLVSAFIFGKLEAAAHEDDESAAMKPPAVGIAIGMVVLGLFGLVVGSRLFLSGAVTIAETLGVPEAVIGLTLVAAGTSLPELATSVVAAFRKRPDIALGNVIGSNIFNLLGILGIAALASPLEVSERLAGFDTQVLCAATLATVAALLIGGRVTRAEGFGLLGCYIAYVWWMIASIPVVD